MPINNLKLVNFRNFNSLNIDIPSNGLCIIGKNGLGKTSILEAINFLLIGKSQRGSIKKKCVNKNENDFFILGEFNEDDLISIGYSKNTNKSIIKKNSKICKTINDWFAQNSVVSFDPFDSDLIFGPPSIRRKFIDIILSITSDEYLASLISYKRAVQNRNKLLEITYDSDLLNIYEFDISKCGNYINKQRELFINSISDKFLSKCKRIIGEENIININRKSTLKIKNVDNYKEMLITSLKENREKDRILGFSTIGPHRDDIQFIFNNSIAKDICSRGQGRILAIILKICSIDWFSDVLHKNPIIMIDDAFSELDNNKTELIYDELKDKGQILITSLSEDNMLDKMLEKVSLDE